MLKDIDEVEIVDENNKSCSYFIIKDTIEFNRMKESLNLLNIDCSIENISDKVKNWELKPITDEHKDVRGLFNRFIYQTSDMDDVIERISKVGQDNLEPVYKKIIKDLNT
ncbi:MAG: hypothetical protein EKK64_03680 [Neisseriaceae bacterium]|nr:MAG: hypothetical protein EKK64_03680 [Neisseriaceae bacterium]